MAYPGQHRYGQGQQSHGYQQQFQQTQYQQQQQWQGPPPQQQWNQGPPQPYYNHPQPPPQHFMNAPPPGGFQGPPQYSGGQFPVHAQPMQNSKFVYSNCTGNRKALLIGINYTGTSSALRGCVNDVKNLQRFLIQRYNFKQDDMVVLTDEQGQNLMSLPTKQNIMRAMQWLVRDARPNDSFFFHYSGHGGQAKDLDGDEDDGYDETIYPLDFKQAGQIIDDDMHLIMVKPLPPGCRLTAIFDSCHSGSALDLPYIYSTAGKIKEPNLLADAGNGAMSAVGSYMRGDLGGVFSSIMSVGKKVATGGKVNENVKQFKTTPADVVMWSGCKDTQTSADTSEAGQATGAMSYAFIAALTKYPQQTYVQLLNSIRDELSAKYSQKPQLSTGHEMDTNLLFII